MRLNLTLGAHDLEQTLLFYREILNLRPVRHQEGTGLEFVLVDFANLRVVFVPLEQLQQQHPVLLQNFDRHHLGTGVQLEMNCPDLDPVMQALGRYDWPVAYELEDDEHRRRELWVNDPDGYLIVLNEEPGEL